ncbi:uncharacterized protein LOC119982273 [Tripterygium wilfordii]|uniref:uncharacterized protein LOC119982273 n=1 Tax=Tripterygium wilfordii TaxID=458696 RepID=UPI0018F8494A|nr:uncharacterized protein LOC119982273 [Tripterygium wilfordii]
MFIASTKSSKAAWEKLKNLYANKFRSRIMSLKERLIRPHNGQSIADYLHHFKAISDELTLIEAPLYDDDLVIHILNGVEDDFIELTAGVHAREAPISFEDLHDKLFEFDAYLHRHETKVDPPVLSANATNRANTTHSFANRGGNQGRGFRPSNASNPTVSAPSFNQNCRNNNTHDLGYRGFY